MISTISISYVAVPKEKYKKIKEEMDINFSIHMDEDSEEMWVESFYSDKLHEVGVISRADTQEIEIRKVDNIVIHY